MSKRSFAHLEYGFDDDLVEDSDEQEQVLESEQVEPQAKKLKQSYDSQLFEDREAVVIILVDSPHHHDYDFYYLNRNNRNTNLLEIKLQATSFLVSEFSKAKYERFLNQTNHEIFCDYMVRIALVRITGKFNFSISIIDLMQQKRYDELPIEILTDRNVALQVLAEYPTKSLFLDHISDDLQNDIQFLLKAFKILKDERNYSRYYKPELPKLIDEMKLSTAVELMKIDKSVFQIIPKRLQKTIEFIPFIVYSLLEEDLSVGRYFIEEEILKEKQLALQFINYIFQNQHQNNSNSLITYYINKFFRNEEFAFCKRQVMNEISFEVMKQCVELDGAFIQHVREEWKDNKEMTMIAVKQNASNVKHISERLKMDKEILLEGIKSDLREVLQYLTQDLLNDKHFILKAIEYNANIVKYISNELQQDKEIWMKALKFGDWADFIIPLKFQRDRDVFKLMIECGLFPEYHIFRNDRELMLKLMKLNPQEFKLLPFNLRNDIEIAKIAISQDGSMLAHVPNELRNDKQIVLQAISNNVDAIEFIGPDLINDRDIALIGVKHKHYLSLVSNELKNDKQIVLKSVEHNRMSIIYASEQLQKDYDIILQASKSQNHEEEDRDLKEWISILSNLIPMECKNNEQFMFKLISESNDDLIILASDELKTNEDFILHLISSKKFNLSNIPKELLVRKTFIKKLLMINKEFVTFIPEEVKKNKEMAPTIIEFYPEFFRKLPKLELQCNIDFILSISNLESVLEFLPDAVFNNKELFTKILKTCPEIDYNEYYQKCSNLRNDRDIILLLCELDISVRNYIDLDDWKSDKEIISALIQKSVSYMSELQISNNSEYYLDYDSVKRINDALFMIRDYAPEWYTDETNLSKLIELLKEPEVTLDHEVVEILEDLDSQNLLDAEAKIELEMKKAQHYKTSDKDIAKRLVVQQYDFFALSEILSDTLLEDQDFILDLMASQKSIDIVDFFDLFTMTKTTLSKYLNMECKTKTHLIDYVIRYALEADEEEEYLDNENSSSEDESD